MFALHALRIRSSFLKATAAVDALLRPRVFHQNRIQAKSFVFFAPGKNNIPLSRTLSLPDTKPLKYLEDGEKVETWSSTQREIFTVKRYVFPFLFLFVVQGAFSSLDYFREGNTYTCDVSSVRAGRLSLLLTWNQCGHWQRQTRRLPHHRTCGHLKDILGKKYDSST
jgi:hypothetical protein